MNNYYLQENTLMASLTLPVIAGALRYKRLDTPAKIFFYVCLLTFCLEALAYYCVIVYHANLPAYNIGVLILTFMVCLYFNYAIGNWTKNNTGYILGVVSIIAGILNMCFLQSIYQITSYFLYYQAILIMVMCILLVKHLLQTGYPEILIKNSHFWLAVILFYSSGLPLLLYVMIDFYSTKLKIDPTLIFWGLYLVNITSYAAITAVFLLYSKPRKNVQ